MTECSNPEDRPLSVVFFDYTRLAGRIVEVAWKRFTLHDLFVETETDNYGKPLVNLEGDGPTIEHAWLFPGYWYEKAPSAADLDTMRQSGVLDRYHTAVTATAAEPDPNQTAAPVFHSSDGFVRLIGDLVAGSMLVSPHPRRMLSHLSQLPTLESGPQPQDPEPDAVLDLLSLTWVSWWSEPAGLDPLDSEQMMDRAVRFRFFSDKQDADTPTGRVDEAYRAACGAFTGPGSFHQWAHAVMCNADHTQTDTEEDGVGAKPPAETSKRSESASNTLATLESRILDYMASHKQPLSAGEIRDGIGANFGVVGTQLIQMANAGTVAVTSEGHGNEYSLPEPANNSNTQ